MCIRDSNTFTTLQNTVNGKANANADNITVSDWATKLGTGDVATGNTNLVTGGKVFDALSAYAKSADLTKEEERVLSMGHQIYREQHLSVLCVLIS